MKPTLIQPAVDAQVKIIDGRHTPGLPDNLAPHGLRLLFGQLDKYLLGKVVMTTSENLPDDVPQIRLGCCFC
jgi:hypothetical protein